MDFGVDPVPRYIYIDKCYGFRHYRLTLADKTDVLEIDERIIYTIVSLHGYRVRARAREMVCTKTGREFSILQYSIVRISVLIQNVVKHVCSSAMSGGPGTGPLGFLTGVVVSTYFTTHLETLQERSGQVVVCQPARNKCRGHILEISRQAPRLPTSWSPTVSYHGTQAETNYPDGALQLSGTTQPMVGFSV